MADPSGRVALVLRRQEHVRLVVVDALKISFFFGKRGRDSRVWRAFELSIRSVIPRLVLNNL